jgi:threonylcarbamoyladenosine tRNA methylthiotransferase MtaB
MRFFIRNFGCRATQADGSELGSALAHAGCAPVHGYEGADLIILNTCTVTASADEDVRREVRRVRRQNPSARILVTGCYAQRAPDELATIEGVAWVVGNSHLSEIPRLVGKLTSPHGESISAIERSPVSSPQSAGNFIPVSRLADDPMSLARGPAKILTGNIFAQTSVEAVAASLPGGDRTRPILKIQDGCNNRCSYCVIPLVRGRSRSLPPDAVLEEVRQLRVAGAKEIVLSGINLGSYGRDLAPRAALADLVRRILSDTQIEQLRFSSIEPQDVTEDFVSLIAASERLAPHFHVPLQSGSDRILRAMHRWYRTAHYAERIALIRRLLPHAAIGADVIVGFPGETDEDFQATRTLIERLPFTYLHVFSFSARPGTAAEKLADAVPPAVIRERARCLRGLAQKKSEVFRAAQSGRTFRALTLNRRGDDWTEALTGNYLKVRVAGQYPANEWHEVRLTPPAKTF